MYVVSGKYFGAKQYIAIIENNPKPSQLREQMYSNVSSIELACGFGISITRFISVARPLWAKFQGADML